MSEPNTSAAEQLFEKALDVAEKHLEAAMKEGGALSGYVAIAMIEDRKSTRLNSSHT